MDKQLAALLAQYDETTKPKSNNQYDLKNYLTTHLEEGIATGEKQIRILPALEGEATPFAIMHGHNFKVDGKWKKFPCLKYNDEGDDCPFCEARAILLKTGKDSDKEKAKQYSSRKFFVTKVIDRENEADGPKFWRFAENYKKAGTYDKIYGLYKALKKDIANPDDGLDVIINIGRNDKNYPTVTGVVPLSPSVLTENAELKAKWLGDTKTWRDVYSVRTYEYLEIVVRGGSPFYDKDNEKWVDKNTMEEKPVSNNNAGLESELTMGGNANSDLVVPNTVVKKETATATMTVEAPTLTTTIDDIEDDDLPF
tara:strand:+ start:10960 stop:11892 length:933 start_codon:yes stop_codon:yes gene_type:complete